MLSIQLFINEILSVFTFREINKKKISVCLIMNSGKLFNTTHIENRELLLAELY